MSLLFQTEFQVTSITPITLKRKGKVQKTAFGIKNWFMAGLE